ncbi:MAG: MFS transporter [Pseudomonadota bacterium]|nr:MFS transporter [Pseudomonadota bacterium]
MTKWKIYPWLVFSTGALFFFLMYTARVSPSIIQEPLMRDFHIRASDYGSLTGLFYVTYLIMQLPVGGLVDRFGAHRLIMITTALFSLACFIFSTTEHLYMIKLSRLLMGFSGSFAFVGTFKLAMIWFPPSMLGLLAGLTQCSGMLGAAFGEGPLSYVAVALGWRGLLFMIGCLMALLCIISVLIMRDPPEKEEANIESFYDLWIGLTQVLKNSQSWLNGLFAGLIFMPTLAFGEVWGTPYMMQVKGFTLHEAGIADGVLFAGWVIGGVIVGSLSDYYQQRKPFFYISALMSALFLFLVIYIDCISFYFCCFCLFCYGLVNTGLITSYALSGEINKPAVSGVSVSFCTFFSVLVGAMCIPVIGYLFDLYDSKVINGVPIYPKEAYQYVFLTFPLLLLLASVVAIWIKETNCRNVTLKDE